MIFDVDDIYEIEEDYKTKLNEKDKEIERLGNELQVQIEDNARLNEHIETQDKKLQQKENIIKEVREKIEGVKICGLRSGKTFISSLLNDILEILDKVDKEK